MGDFFLWYMHIRLLSGSMGLKDNRNLATRHKGDVTQSATSSQTYEKMRRFKRYRYDVRMQVSVFRDGTSIQLWGRTSEVGLDGIGATLTGELKTGEVVSLEFPIPFAPLVIKVRAIVRYSDGLRCGFEFLVVTSQQREMMRRLSEGLENGPEGTPLSLHRSRLPR
jgi:PilZ domain